MVYLPSVDREIKLDEKNSVFMNEKPDFELDLCSTGKHVIAKMYKLLLKMNMEDEYVKDYMIKRVKILDTT